MLDIISSLLDHIYICTSHATHVTRIDLLTLALDACDVAPDVYTFAGVAASSLRVRAVHIVMHTVFR